MMGCNVFLLLKLLLISEFHSHCSCLSHQYHFVNINLTWTDAQAYCRKNYTDLATIDNMEEMKRLTESVGTGYTGEAWIGLKNGGSWRWQWSSGEGDTGYTNWDKGEPNNMNNMEHCTAMRENNTWNDIPCSSWSQTGYFICYTGVQGYKGNPEISGCLQALTEKRTVVRLTVSTDGDIMDPALSSLLLMQLQEKLIKAGMSGTKLSWRTQPDGQIFHLKD